MGITLGFSVAVLGVLYFFGDILFAFSPVLPGCVGLVGTKEIPVC